MTIMLDPLFNLSRQVHDANTVLFYMFGLGALLMFALFHRHIFWPDATAFYYLMLCGGAGILGQFLITLGFRYVTAVEGGVISSTRILLAALLGPWLAAEPSLDSAGWVGALLLFGANVVLAVRKGRSPERKARPECLSETIPPGTRPDNYLALTTCHQCFPR